METKKIFRVAVVADLDERGWRVLTVAARLTTGRSRSYQFEAVPVTAPDIYLVDGEDSSCVHAWQSISALHPAPAVTLRSNPDYSTGKWEFSRQLVPSCVLKLVTLLDKLSIQELHFLPELKIGQEEALSDASLTMTASRPSPSQSHFSALVVDDSSTVRAQVGLGLKIFGARADFAGSAEEAFELLARNRYDIAFLDVVLPGADGYQVCKTIKKNQKHRATVVIMLTSKSSAFDRVKASLAGCDSFLTKPVQNEHFQEVLAKYLVSVTGQDGHLSQMK